MLKVHSVATVIGGRFAARGVSFEVGRGCCIAILGRSGSGKTTILRTIVGLLQPAEGEVSIGGQVVASRAVSVAPHRRGIGYLFQNLALWPNMTVWDNLYHALDASTSREARCTKVAAYGRRFNLEAWERRYPESLSGGERQRVALARTLIREPQVLLLDEPLSSIDRMFRGGFLSLLCDLKKEAELAVVLVTHEPEGLGLVADDIAILEQGRIVESGPADELLRRQSTAVGQGLLGPLLVSP